MRTIRRSVLAKDKANRAQLCMWRQRQNRGKRQPMSDDQRLINRLTDRELKRWRNAGKPRMISEIKAVIWWPGDLAAIDSMLACRGFVE